MLQINISKSKNDLSDLVDILETSQEDEIYILRNGIEVAKLTLITNSDEKRIGAAKGCFSVPDEFDSEPWNMEIENLFEK